MKKRIVFIISLLAMAQTAFNQSYNSPESIVYDAAGKRYFISNKDGNSIVQLSSDKKLTNFVTAGLQNPKGLFITGDTLISVNNKNVQGFLLSDATKVFQVDIAGAVWMNDVAKDKQGNIYVSDSETGSIIKIVLNTLKYTTLATIPSGPNGLFYNDKNNSLLICNSGINAQIYSIALTTTTTKKLITTKFADLDGIARDNCGNFYISSWATSSVYAYDSLFQNPPTLVSKGHSGPADISINENEQVLAIPNFNSNTISLIGLNMGCKQVNNLMPQKNSLVSPSDSVRFDWDDVATVTSYELQYSTDSTFTLAPISLKTTNSKVAVGGLKPQTKYFWRVRATNGNEKSIFNAVWSFTTTVATLNDRIGDHSSEFEIYPNPSTGKIFIATNQKQQEFADYSIFDCSGKLVGNGIVQNATLDLSALNNGFYLLSIKTGQTTICKKISITK